MNTEDLLPRLRVAAEVANAEGFSHTAVALKRIARQIAIDYADAIDTRSIQGGARADALLVGDCAGQSRSEAKPESYSSYRFSPR